MKHLLALLGCLCAALAAAQPQADSAARTVTRATLFSIGLDYQQDTYLSPLAYDGLQIAIFHETLRPTHLLSHRVDQRTLFQASFTRTQNQPRNADYLGGQLHYDYALQYRWQPSERWRLMLGPQLGATAGILYNTRNGNNPAQALARIQLSAAGAAQWRLHTRRRELALRATLDFALFGAMFTPAYGQSYYELFTLGHTDHNVRATHPFNTRRIRSQVTLDVPCRVSTLRVGCYADLHGSHVNAIRHSDYSVGLLIGWVRHHLTRPARRTIP